MKKNNCIISYLFIGEYGGEVNEKIICTFDNYDIGMWVMELLHKQMHFITRKYFDDKYIDCIEYPYKAYGQTLFKFCFDDVSNMEDLDSQIEFKCKWIDDWHIRKGLFNDKIKKIILLRNKLK